MCIYVQLVQYVQVSSHSACRPKRPFIYSESTIFNLRRNHKDVACPAACSLCPPFRPPIKVTPTTFVMLSLLLILGLCSRIAISVDGRVASFATPLRPSPRPKRCTTSARSRRRNKRGATLSPTTSHDASSSRRTSLASQVPEGDYYGAADSSYVVKEFR